MVAHSDNGLQILQEKRIVQEIADIEKDTGFKLRVLAQNYPDTPGILCCCFRLTLLLINF